MQRGQIDYWENCEVSADTVITSSCENSTGSASHLLSSPLNQKLLKPRRKSQGHIISITTTKRHRPSLLNKSKTTQWNVERDGKELRYYRIKWQSDDQSVPKRLTDTKEKNSSIPVINTTDEIHEGKSISFFQLFSFLLLVLDDVPINTDSKPFETIAPEFFQPPVYSQSKQISYASTDEDVDELNSHYSDVLDRPQFSRTKFS